MHFFTLVLVPPKKSSGEPGAPIIVLSPSSRPCNTRSWRYDIVHVLGCQGFPQIRLGAEKLADQIWCFSAAYRIVWGNILGQRSKWCLYLCKYPSFHNPSQIPSPTIIHRIWKIQCIFKVHLLTPQANVQISFWLV